MPIFDFTAEDAMNDGILFDESKMAREAGFIWPVRITIGVRNLLVPDEEARDYGQSYEGRLWDVLSLTKVKIRLTEGEQVVSFEVLLQHSPKRKQVVTLWAAIDETSGLAIHILLPHEF